MLQGDNYSWQGVLNFLHKQHENHVQQQNIWFLQKKGLNEQIKELQARVTSLESINNDLMSRNKMLQYCLRQMKGQTQKLEKDYQNFVPKIPERRPKPNKNHINKVLQSLGIRNLIENIQKDLQMRGKPPLKLQEKIGTARQKEKSIQSMKSTIYKQTNTLTGHQDGVRDLLFYSQNNILISASEDCTLKLWNIKSNQFDCLGTIREHSGPIFTVIQAQKYVLTGGMQGIIRGWDFRNVSEKKDINKKNMVGSWSNSEEQKLQPIWQLFYSSQHSMLFSTSSQCAIKSYKLDFQSDRINNKSKNTYFYHPAGYSAEQEDIPTSICVHHGSLVSGYVNNHSLINFDIETTKVIKQLKFTANGQFSTNKVISHPNVIIAAFQDKMVRLFDDSKMTYSFKAHEDSVMSLALTSNMNQFFTCGHDGCVKLWDLRKFQAISTFNAHNKKYDESVHCVSTSNNFKAASGGADALIKVYQANL